MYLEGSDEYLARRPGPHELERTRILGGTPPEAYLKRDELPGRQFVDVLGCDPAPPDWYGPQLYWIFPKDETGKGLRQVKELLLGLNVERRNFYIQDLGWVDAMLSNEQRDLVRLSPLVSDDQEVVRTCRLTDIGSFS